MCPSHLSPATSPKRLGTRRPSDLLDPSPHSLLDAVHPAQPQIEDRHFNLIATPPQFHAVFERHSDAALTPRLLHFFFNSGRCFIIARHS